MVRSLAIDELPPEHARVHLAWLLLGADAMNVVRFRSLVRAVLLSAGPAGVVACSADPTPMPERAQCIDPRAPTRYAALTLAPTVDGIAFATRGEELSSADPDGGAQAPPQRLPDLGTPCARATDRAACEAQVAALLADPSSEGWVLATAGRWVAVPRLLDLGVITSGDSVRLATFPDILAAVSPIETRDEAAAVLLLQTRTLDCDANNVRPEADGSWTFKFTSRSCDGEVAELFYNVGRDGSVRDSGQRIVTEGDDSCIEGRRPANLAPTNVAWLSSIEACFSEIAHMEMAAVLAFDELDCKLRALGAPADLVTRAARARAEEVEHAALTAALARRFGGRPPLPRIDGEASSANEAAYLELALENAVEGCVREAYGALVAAHQAAHASDPAVRSTFARIAVDEAEHAELSFALDAWLATRLSPAERARVERAKVNAWIDLAAACGVEPAPDVVRIAGIPTARGARALLASLHLATLAA